MNWGRTPVDGFINAKLQAANLSPQSEADLHTLIRRLTLGHTARRLVENGVRFVEILDGATGPKWDAHGNRDGLIGNHRTNAARTDQGLTALIIDPRARGMLDETLIV